MMAESLSWSARLQIAPSQSRRLHGDKITLPQSALEALLAAAPVVPVEDRHIARHTAQFDPFNPFSFAAEVQARGALSDRQQQLPHPLTFRLVNPTTGRIVYAGIREFSADEGTVEMSSVLSEMLGYSDLRDGKPDDDKMAVDGEEGKFQTVTVHAHQLSKGTYVRLRPLEAGYDPEDWKSLLERYLRDNYTTLTNGEILVVPGARHEHFRFLVDKFEPEGEGICIVDTDLEVDIEALNEEQAKETLDRRLAKTKRAPGSATGSSAGGLITVKETVNGQILPGEYVNYELAIWDRNVDLEVRLDTEDDIDLDILANPFSDHQRGWPRLDDHVFADLSTRPSKRLKLSHTNVHLEDVEKLHISVRAPALPQSTSNVPVSYSIAIWNSPNLNDDLLDASEAEPGADEVRCKNCHQIIPKRTLPLHEAFCYRNNVACPKCKNVFLRNSDSWKSHWHCPHDEQFGNNEHSRLKHDSIYHPSSPLTCPACDFEAYDIPILAQHRTTTCPAKDILCQFCHLIVPQQGPEDPSFHDAEVLLSGLTPHEVSDGARTTDCHLCGKFVTLRNMKTHMKLHDHDRVLRPKPKICVNPVCGRAIKSGKEVQADSQQLGLCDECFGPLYGTAHDPDGKALRRRIERRLLQQLMGGCGKVWCHNVEWCRTGRKNSTGEDMVVSAKDALPIVKPVLNSLISGDSSGLRFCCDEASQIRRNTAELITAEGEYELEWSIKALEESKNDLGRAREWLKDMAPKRDEVVR